MIVASPRRMDLDALKQELFSSDLWDSASERSVQRQVHGPPTATVDSKDNIESTEELEQPFESIPDPSKITLFPPARRPLSIRSQPYPQSKWSASEDSDFLETASSIFAALSAHQPNDGDLDVTDEEIGSKDNVTSAAIPLHADHSNVAGQELGFQDEPAETISEVSSKCVEPALSMGPQIIVHDLNPWHSDSITAHSIADESDTPKATTDYQDSETANKSIHDNGNDKNGDEDDEHDPAFDSQTPTVEYLDRYWRDLDVSATEHAAAKELEKENSAATPGLPWHRRHLPVVVMFALLVLIAALIAVLVVLNGFGIIHIFSGGNGGIPDFSRLLPVPKAPDDPSKTLIVPSNTPAGPFGCSNVPIRAPLESNLYTNASLGSGDTCSMRYTLTECDLLSAMRASSDVGTASYFRQTIQPYLPHMLTAFEVYDLNCSPERLSAALATIRHETNDLQQMEQPLDGGAGSVHLVPHNFYLFISQTPAVREVYQQSERSTFEDVVPLERLPSSLSNQAFIHTVADLISRPENTFLVAGWWFKSGAQQVLEGCSDLRVSADQGLGSANGTGPNGAVQTTGFYDVTRCVYGTIQDPGISQRITYYQDIHDYATANMKCQTLVCS